MVEAASPASDLVVCGYGSGWCTPEMSTDVPCSVGACDHPSPMDIIRDAGPHAYCGSM